MTILKNIIEIALRCSITLMPFCGVKMDSLQSRAKMNLLGLALDKQEPHFK